MFSLLNLQLIKLKQGDSLSDWSFIMKINFFVQYVKIMWNRIEHKRDVGIITQDFIA